MRFFHAAVYLVGLIEVCAAMFFGMCCAASAMLHYERDRRRPIRPILPVGVPSGVVRLVPRVRAYDQDAEAN